MLPISDIGKVDKTQFCTPLATPEPVEDPTPAPAAPVPSPTTPAPLPSPTAGGCSDCTGACLEYSFRTDSNPGQNRLKIKDTDNGNTLLETTYGDFASPNTLYTGNVCAQDSCFMVKVDDKGKDGLQNGGYYSLVVDDETVVDQSSDFGKTEKTQF